MRIISKLWKWIAALMILAVVLMLLAPVLTAHLFNHDTIREQLTSRVADDTNARLDFQNAYLTILPRPYLNIRHLQVTEGTEISVEAAAARIYPKLLPLLSGRLEFDRISLESPKYTLQLPNIPDAPTPPEHPRGIDDVHRQLDRFRYLMGQIAPMDIPDVELTIRNGRVVLIDMTNNRPAFELRHINGHYERYQSRMDFTIDCMSNAFKEIAIRGWVDPNTFKGIARVDLAAFQPEGVINYFYPDAKLQISDAQLNITLDIDAEGKDQIRIDLTGSMPRMRISNNGRHLDFSDQQFRAGLAIEKQSLGFHLADFSSAAPRMNLTGDFSIDDAAPSVNLHLVGGSVDVAGVRSAALFMLGDEETVADIFDVLREGEIPQMTVTASGDRLSDLELARNYTIAGQMEDGRLYIPDLDFDLQSVSGNAVIASGVLKGKHLKASFGNSSGSDGTLTLDLEDGDLFELGIDLKADLAQLPPVLHRVVDDKAFTTELNQITEVAGNASGKLMIAMKGNNTRVDVNVSSMSLSARYDRIPYPLSVSQGRMKLRGDRMTLSSLNLSSGQAKLNGLEGRIDWTKSLLLELKAGTLKLDAAEVKSWLPGQATTTAWTRTVKDLKGGADLKDLTLGYNTPATGNEQINVGGRIAHATLTAEKLPSELTISGGTFRYHRDQLDLSGLNAGLGQSNLDQAGATLVWGTRKTLKASALRAELDLGELFPWLTRIKGDPGKAPGLKALSGKLMLSDPSVRGPMENPAAWQWDTDARLQGARIESRTFGAPIQVAAADLRATNALSGKAAGTRILLKPSIIAWGPSHLTVGGKTGIFEKSLNLDLQITADQLQWDQIEHIINQADQLETSDNDVDILGTISVKTEQFQYDELTWKPVNATLTLSSHETNLAVARAGLCGIDFSGYMDFADERVNLQLIPVAKGKPLEPTIKCLSKNKNMATGQYDFSGRLEAKSKTADLNKSVSGDLSLAAAGGRIHSFGVLARIFAILNVTEIYRGQLPDLTGEGFAYDTMTIVADMEKSKLTMRECTVEAPSMGLACEGEIDLAKKEMDLVILVAPFRTVDRIVKHIPIVGGIMGGKLISIPFRAKGELSDPYVIPLSPTAVGSGVLGILERTLKLPITIMEPLFSNSEPEKESSERKD